MWVNKGKQLDKLSCSSTQTVGDRKTDHYYINKVPFCRFSCWHCTLALAIIVLMSCKYCAIMSTAPGKCANNMHVHMYYAWWFDSHRLTGDVSCCPLLSCHWGGNELIFYYWLPRPFMCNDVMLWTGAWKKTQFLVLHKQTLIFISFFIKQVNQSFHW